MSPPAPRKGVTKTACVPCRESKIKVTPICGCCAAKQRECRFEEIDDKRRLSLRVAMELLCSRIDQLYSFINDNEMQAPQMDTHNHAILLKVFSHQRLPYDMLSKDLRPSKDSPSKLSPVGNSDQVAEQQTAQQQQQLSQAQNVPRMPNITLGDTADLTTTLSDYPTSLDGSNVPNFGWEDMPNHTGWGDVQPDFLTCMGELQPMPPHEINIKSFSQIQAAHRGTQGPDGLDTQQDDVYDSDGDSINTEALANQLSERIGSLHIGPVGHIRFLGPTSYFSLIKTPRAEQPLGWQQRRVQNTQDYLARIGLGKTVPTGLEEHLTNLYFAWQDPSLHVVSRSMYESARARKCNGEETPYYSESLQNAICALGAAFETRHHASIVTFPRSLAEFFAERAKSLLDAELDCPSVATVQALVVLSSHEIGSNNDSRGWLFCGMAMRLALDLGLHMNPRLHVLRGNLTQEEADVRADVFWGAYLGDQSWGFYLGKPIRTHTGDITISEPQEPTDPKKVGQWAPYIDSALAENAPGVPDLVPAIHRQRVILAKIMAPVANAVYGDFTIPTKALQERNVETVASLLSWKTSLPRLLQINENDLDTRHVPQLLLLHMHYYQNVIHAHRPYMSKTYNQPFPPQGPGSGHARMMCKSSAVLIAKLLRIYEMQHGFRKINVQAVGITCSAAMLLLYANVTKSSPEADLEMHLSTCFRALDEFGLSWHNAKTARECLLLLQRQWEAKSESERSLLRRVPTYPTITDPTQTKRHCSSHGQSSWMAQEEGLDVQTQRPGSSHESSVDGRNLGLNAELDWDYMVAFPFIQPPHFGSL